MRDIGRSMAHGSEKLFKRLSYIRAAEQLRLLVVGALVITLSSSIVFCQMTVAVHIRIGAWVNRVLLHDTCPFGTCCVST